jgi:hypothetical protein
VLCEPIRWWGIVALGHLAPVALLLTGWLLPHATLLFPLAGLALLGGGLMLKSALITKASYLVDVFDRFGANAVQIGRAVGERPGDRVAA